MDVFKEVLETVGDVRKPIIQSMLVQEADLLRDGRGVWTEGEIEIVEGYGSYVAGCGGVGGDGGGDWVADDAGEMGGALGGGVADGRYGRY